jgi:hypothetical protein
MMYDSEDEELAYWQRIAEVQDDLIAAGVQAGIALRKFGNDLIVSGGALTDLMEFCQDNRSEIEELLS